jgi:hypothetical protein
MQMGNEFIEKESLGQERKIQLNETFRPFKTRGVIRNEKGLHSKLVLSCDEIPPFSLEARVRIVKKPTSLFGITPFDPGAGYQITEGDTSFQTRKEKVIDLTQKGGKDIADVVSLWLTFYSSGEDLERAGIVTKRMRVWDGDRQEAPYFTAKNLEYYEILKSLRIKLFFPSGKIYESKPDESAFQTNREILHLRFAYFYPTETGPLPILSALDTGTMPRHKGLEIFLPDNVEELSKIEASIFESRSGQ